MRRAHWLKANHEGQLPSHRVFVDTETRPIQIDDSTEEATLDFGWACYERRIEGHKWSKPEWIRFTKHAEFWRWLDDKCKAGRKVYVFAHNMSFDFTVLKGWHYARKLLGKPKTVIIEGPPTIITYRRHRKTLTFICTLNYFRHSLKSLGESIGLDKLEMPAPEASLEAWNEYAVRDVEIIRRAIDHLFCTVRRWDLGNFRPTLAAQSFASYRHRFLSHPIYIDDNVKALRLARASYYGGRVECYRLGTVQGTVYGLDINSQYPCVMRNGEFPTRLCAVWGDVSIDELQSLLTKYKVIADVTLHTNSPAFPYRHEGRLIFPVGTFRTALASPELVEAIKQGAIRKVWRVAFYESAPLFTDFVDFFYEKRLQERAAGHEALAYMLKILMNSLYGKFGQSGRKYHNVGEGDPDVVRAWNEIDAETGQVTAMRQFAGVIQAQSREGESFDSHPAIAAHITSEARMMLWRFMNQAGRENVYYVDTDSLYVNARGYGLLAVSINDTRLGGLKLEREADGMEIRGAKDYSHGDYRRIKGVRSNADQVRPGVFRQPTFVGFKGMLRRGDMLHQIIRHGEKRLTRVYRKGIVEPGGAIKPIRLETQAGSRHDREFAANRNGRN